MHLKTFKTLWGNTLPIEEACNQALDSNFNGIEGRAPQDDKESNAWQKALKANGCEYIAEIVTGGDYVPNRQWTIEQHLQDIEQQIQSCLPLEPLFATCITGCDAWSEPEMQDFFAQAMLLGQKHGLKLSFETHRSRCLFTPWITERLVQQLPDISLTADISHWCVVTERLMDSELSSMHNIANNIHHIHGRIGYDQGPQVPDPAAPEYQNALKSHQAIWEVFWQAQHQSGYRISTLTPEFGPDGYCHLQPYTQQPVADIWQINQWMNRTEQQHFQTLYS